MFDKIINLKHKILEFKMFKILIGFLFTFGVSIMLTSSSSPNKIFPFDYQIKELENGLKFILIKVPSKGLVAYYTIVRTGSRDEFEPGHTGFAHFFEHMMFRGTKKYPANTYDKIITEMGSNANAYTTDDYTCYHLSFAKENLEKVIELESDRFQNLFYKEKDFQTEAGAVYGEYRKGKTNPFFWIWETLCNTAFDKHTYKHTTIGFEEDIKRMPEMYDYSLSFFDRYYRPENSILLITGDIEYQPTIQLIEKYYSNWKKGYQAPQIPTEPEQKKERRAVVNYPGKSLPILAVAYKGLKFDPTDKTTIATIIFGELAFGENSELYKKLYLKDQIIQFLEPEFPMTRDPFLWIIWAQIKNEKDIKYVESEIDRTIREFQTKKIDNLKLDNLKKRIRYSFLMNIDTPDKVAGKLARFLALTADMNSIDNYFTTLNSISPEDIVESAKSFFVQEKRTLITLIGRK